MASLADLIGRGPIRPNIDIHPAVDEKILHDIKRRMEDEIDPSEFYAMLSDDESASEAERQEFLEKTFDIIEDSVRNNLDPKKTGKLDGNALDWLKESYFDRSQEFWWELYEGVKSGIDFVDSLSRESRKLVHATYPEFDQIMGLEVYYLFHDMVFQALLKRYSKVVKPTLVDSRRIINMAGQVTEAILSQQLFSEAVTIGEGRRRLEFERQHSHDLIQKKRGSVEGVFKKSFLNNLRSLERLRNAYSHGGDGALDIEDAISKCWNSLVFADQSVLTTLYHLCSSNRTTH